MLELVLVAMAKISLNTNIFYQQNLGGKRYAVSRTKYKQAFVSKMTDDLKYSKNVEVNIL